MAKYLVIGASSDIGQAICRKALSEGHSVHGTFFNNEDDLKGISKEFSGRFTVSKLDVSNLTDVEKFSVKGDVFNKLDALVFCPAVIREARFENFSADDFYHDITANYLSAVFLTRRAAEGMKANGGGRILWLGSIGTKFGGGRDSFLYALTKHMMEFIPSVARQWAEDGVLFNTLQVGVTDTKFHKAKIGKDLAARAKLIPMQRPAKAEEIAEYINWLISDKNTYIAAQVLTCAGGE